MSALKIQVFLPCRAWSSFCFASSGCHDEHRFVRVASCSSRSRCGCGQHFVWIQQDAGGRHEMIIRNGDPQQIIAKLQGEFAAAQELLVLPPLIVRVGRHPGIPMCDLVNVVAIILEVLVARAAADDLGVVDLIIPCHGKDKRLARQQRAFANRPASWS